VRFELRDDRLWRDGQPWFPVGVNYHPSTAGIRMWRCFPEAEISADLDAMASAGVTLVRIFVYWADLEPTRGDHCPVVLERLRRFGEMAHARGLGLLVSALTIWMNGQRFFPPWLEGRNLWTDPVARERSKAAVAAVAAAVGTTGAVVAYDLGDELPHADQRSIELSADAVAAWQRELVAAVRSGDPSAIVTQANEASSVFGRSPFGPDNLDGLDFAAVHGYPWWGPSVIASHRDPSASLLASYLASYSRAYGSVLIDEIGAYVAGPEVTAAHLRASLPSLAAAGALGVVVWSWKDIVAPGSPYEQRPSERRTGLVDSSDRPRAALAVVSQFAAEAEAVWSKAQRRPPSVAIFIPQQERAHDSTYLQDESLATAGFPAFLLCSAAHLPVEFTIGPQPYHRLIICPSPWRLTEPDMEVLRGAVLRGATLLASVGDPGGGLLGTELSGVAVNDFVPGRRHGRFRFAGNTYDLRWPVGGRAAVLQSVGAEIVATFEDSSPALTRFRTGAGEVWLLNAPFERQLTDADDLADPKWADLYGAIGARAGVVAPVGADHGEIELQRLVVGGADKLLVVNHGAEAVETTIGSAATGWRSVHIAGKSSLLLEDDDANNRIVSEALAR
jgi:hypothetical protein